LRNLDELFTVTTVIVVTAIMDFMADLPTRPTQTPNKPPNVGSLCFLISKDLRTALDRGLAPFQLRAQQAAVLLRCCWQSGAKPSQLASDVGTDTAGITGLIDQLEKHGLVIRRANPSDRRTLIVEPTKAGKSMVPQIRQVFQTVNRQLLAGFSEIEVAELEGMLQRLRNNVEEYLVEETKQVTATSLIPSRRKQHKKSGVL
jgi:DNA-binding MarR family transcriptional regulator